MVDSVEIDWLGGSRETWRGLEADRRWILEEGVGPRSDAGAGVTERRSSDLHDRAVVADVSTHLDREAVRRFWDLKRESDRLFVEGKWEACAEILAEMTRIDARHEDALYNRGNCFLEMGEFASAARCWNDLVEVNPSSSRAWTQLGVLHSIPEAGELFDLERAVAALRRSHRINPEESGPLLVWGEAELARGDLAAAEEVLSSAHRMNDRATSAFYLSAYLAWKRGDEAAARELLDRALESIVVEQPVRGVAGEGDTRSADMLESRRRARGRLLFAECTESLAEIADPGELDRSFACVDAIRSRIPPSRVENRRAHVGSE
jgi:hypothetical protein